MTAQKGKDLLIKIADGAGYTTVAGLRSVSHQRSELSRASATIARSDRS